ncbi:MAG: 50S ribosomal protein L17 [Candidatus Kapaibacteriales bacterium]
MRHLKSGWKLKRTYSHRKALLRNLATDLIEHKKIETTLAKAKALRPFVEKLITRAKKAHLWEKFQNETNPKYDKNGNKIPYYHVFYRRFVGRYLTKKSVLQELFETVAPVIADRPGGYTRIVKTGFRRGDSAEMAVIELVDWGAPQDGAISLKSKSKAKKAVKAKTKKATKTAKAKDVEQKEQQTLVPIPEKFEQSQTTQTIESSQSTESKEVNPNLQSADNPTEAGAIEQSSEEPTTETNKDKE